MVRFATSPIRIGTAAASRKCSIGARNPGTPGLECSALNALSHVLHFTHRLDEMGVRASEALRVAESSGYKPSVPRR